MESCALLGGGTAAAGCELECCKHGEEKEDDCDGDARSALVADDGLALFWRSSPDFGDVHGSPAWNNERDLHLSEPPDALAYLELHVEEIITIFAVMLNRIRALASLMSVRNSASCIPSMAPSPLKKSGASDASGTSSISPCPSDTFECAVLLFEISGC
jgi:hypothetical protein